MNKVRRAVQFDGIIVEGVDGSIVDALGRTEAPLVLMLKYGLKESTADKVISIIDKCGYCDLPSAECGCEWSSNAT